MAIPQYPTYEGSYTRFPVSCVKVDGSAMFVEVQHKANNVLEVSIVVWNIKEVVGRLELRKPVDAEG